MKRENKGYSTPEELGAYLAQFRLPLDSWGKGNAKEIAHLLAEINSGDCKLVEEEGNLIRRVHFVNISVIAEFDGKIHTLIEDRQVFNEGAPQQRIRTRRELRGAVKEKMYRSENQDDAVTRAIREELGLQSKVNFVKTYSEDIDKESASYPGLRSQYRAHYYLAYLKGDQIHKEGYKEIHQDKTTYFVWN
jgi:hypothetical protein